MGADYMNRCAQFGERARFAQVTCPGISRKWADWVVA